MSLLAFFDETDHKNKVACNCVLVEMVTWIEVVRKKGFFELCL